MLHTFRLSGKTQQTNKQIQKTNKYKNKQQQQEEDPEPRLLW